MFSLKLLRHYVKLLFLVIRFGKSHGNGRIYWSDE